MTKFDVYYFHPCRPTCTAERIAPTAQSVSRCGTSHASPTRARTWPECKLCSRRELAMRHMSISPWEHHNLLGRQRRQLPSDANRPSCPELQTLQSRQENSHETT